MDFARDLGLFLLGAFGVVVVTAFLAHPDDASAWRSVPRRALVFVGSCAALAVALWICGHWFAALE